MLELDEALEGVAIRDVLPRVKKLAVSGGLFWKKQKLVCDLLAPFFLEFSALKDGADVLVEASLVRGKSRASIEKVFPAPMPIVLAPPFLYFVDCDLRLLQKFSKGSLVLSYEEWNELKEDCDENVIIKEEGEEAAMALPKLILTDGTGSFAACETSEWIEDLLEVGYRRSQEGFYCPGDCVQLAITKLIEKGWEVVDPKGRTVLLQKAVLFEEGCVDFGEEQAAFSALQGSFVGLSDSKVGLLDREEIPEEFVGRKTALSKVELASVGQIPEGKEVLPGEGFRGELFPYQQVGINWLHRIYGANLCGILADEMGLGKSVQLLAFFSGLNLSHPRLIVAPTSLLQNWQREVERFWPEAKPYLYYGEERDAQKIKSQNLVLTSYAILRRDIAELSQVEWGAVALDEAQVIKNPKSQTFAAACCLKAVFRLSITGTPIENHLGELFTQFQFLLPDLKTGDPKRLNPFILRRTKEEVALDLPEKLEQIVYVGMNAGQKVAYEAMLEKTRQEEGLTHMEVLERLLRLRQICCDPRLIDETAEMSTKLKRLVADIEELEGKKVLVYSQFTQMLKLIAKELETRGISYLYLDGKTKNRMELVDQFQNAEGGQVFLISLKAGGVGLNLTAADYVLIFDPWWNEAVENQAIDRAHRIGRTGAVIARRYVTIGSLEEKIMQMKDRKRELIESSLNSEWVLEELLS